LTLVGNAQLCHGQWTAGGWQPPSQIQCQTHGAWQSESGGKIPIIGDIATGTEGWIKYEISPNPADPCAGSAEKGPRNRELVYIHWDNPYVWSNGTNPSDQQVSTNDVSPPCNKGKSPWDGGTFGNQPLPATHELFIAGGSSNGEGFDWGTGPVGQVFDVLLVWPALVIGGLAQLEGDINIEIILGLRAVGSVSQTIFSFYDGTQGLSALAKQAGQQSLRKLFNF